MSLSNYSDLQTAIVNFTHRADLASIAPDLIRLAEDEIYADLDSRQQDTDGTLTCTASVQTVALPTDFIGMKALSVSSTTPQGTIDFLPPQQFKQEFQFPNTGVPRVFTIIGNNIYLAPIPDQAYTLSMIYEAKLTNLSSTNTTNFLLTSFPSAYLYAGLVQAAIYIKDADAEAVWRDKYRTIIDGINKNDWANANTMAVNTDVNLTYVRL